MSISWQLPAYLSISVLQFSIFVFYATVGSPEHNRSIALLEPPCAILINEWKLSRKSPPHIDTSIVAIGKSRNHSWALTCRITTPCTLMAASCTTYFDGLRRGQTQRPPSPSTSPAATQPLILALSSPPKVFQAKLQLLKLGHFEVVSQCPWNCHPTSGGTSPAVRASYRVHVSFLWNL